MPVLLCRPVNRQLELAVNLKLAVNLELAVNLKNNTDS